MENSKSHCVEKVMTSQSLVSISWHPLLYTHNSSTKEIMWDRAIHLDSNLTITESNKYHYCTWIKGNSVVRWRFIYRLKQEMNAKIINVGIILIAWKLTPIHWDNPDFFLIIIWDKSNIYFYFGCREWEG